MDELFKCFLTGLSGFGAIFAVLGLTWVFMPYSAYVWGCLFFAGICIAIGSDIRSGRAPR